MEPLFTHFTENHEFSFEGLLTYAIGLMVVAFLVGLVSFLDLVFEVVFKEDFLVKGLLLILI